MSDNLPRSIERTFKLLRDVRMALHVSVKAWLNAAFRSALPRAGCTVFAAVALSGCSRGVLDPQGPIGAGEKTILLDSLGIMLAIVIPLIVATLGMAWWYRASNTRAKRLPDWAYSGRVELVVWSIPLLIIFFLGGITWIGSHDLDPYKVPDDSGPPLEVQVVSLDWKWLFIYPQQGVASINQLMLPAGTPVHFTLTSASVMNAFFVPQLGSMIYTMNGMTTQLHLQADSEGTFDGLSSHFSGDGFPGMHFKVHAMSRQGFEGWIATAKGAGQALDEARYAELSKQSLDVAPTTFASVTPDLFTNIAMQRLPPGPGPRPGAPSRDVSPKSGG